MSASGTRLDFVRRAVQWLAPTSVAKRTQRVEATPLEAGLRAAFGPEFKVMGGWFDSLRSDYFASKQNRMVAQRAGVPNYGAGADFHYRHEGDYLRMLEHSRELDRNDPIVGQALDRAITNTVQDGIQLDAKTGDDGVDRELNARWVAWTSDPRQCDLSGEHNFHELRRLALRQMLLDGDHFALGMLDTGALQLIESHRVRTPTKAARNIVHGVELSPTRQRLAYWISKDEIDPMATAPRGPGFQQVPAFTEDGVLQAFHVYAPKRTTQTRGVTAFAPIISVAMLFDDIQFAKLVQQAVVSCWAILRERPVVFNATVKPTATGEKRVERLLDGTERIIQGVSPGMMVTGNPGDKLTAFSPNIPNPEYLPYVRLILTLVGINLGLPLVMLLMDASETNFSGWRGAVDQARMGFRANQNSIIGRFDRPVYLWKLKQWTVEDPSLAAAEKRLGTGFYSHKFNAPRWPYVEPKKDVEAATMRVDGNLTSPRRMDSELGGDHDDIKREIIEDRSLLVTLAAESARKINEKYPEARLDWRELAGPKWRLSQATAGAVEDDDDDENEGGKLRAQSGTERRSDDDDDEE